MQPAFHICCQSRVRYAACLAGLMAAVYLLVFSNTVRLPRVTDTLDPHPPFLSISEAALSSMTERQLEQLYFDIAQHRQIECPRSKRIGGAADGGWDVCFAKGFDISLQRKRTAAEPNCLAFSFGISYVFGYDDELADLYQCRVLMFDPSMRRSSNHQRRKLSWFYKIGLAGNNTVSSDGWTMQTLCSLFRKFGVDNGTLVDILKVDIELWEWESFERALQDGCLTRVKQLLFESHTDGMHHRQSDYRRYIRVWLGLFRLGFRTWKWHENPMSIYYRSKASWLSRPCCYEHYLVNTAFVK